MRFVKMHGLGNDYVYLDAVNAPRLAARRDLPALARAMSDRHRGVGSDGLILVCRPTKNSKAHVRMRMFNADGSESEMCGNGVRCVAKFAHDRLNLRAHPLLVETGRGVLSIKYSTRAHRLVQATVDMGTPILEWSEIPVRDRQLAWVDRDRHHCGGIEAASTCFAATFVSMGNPHAVIFQNPQAKQRDFTRRTLKAIQLSHVGPAIESHKAFPRRTNVHFVATTSRREAVVRTWERGAGATQACGTGACAVLVAGVLTGRLDRRATLHLPGGPLDVKWDRKSGHVFMAGPATDVFEGDWPH